MAPGPDDKDRELALRARRGDRDALAALYESHKGRLLGFLQRMVGSGGLAEDVFQDVWMKVMSAMHQYKPNRGPFHAWLYRVASNAAVDRLRSEAARGRWLLDETTSEGKSILDGVPSAGPDPERRLAGLETERNLERVLAGIGSRQRSAILLRHQLGFTYTEISSILGVAEGTAKTLVHRGILAVRQQLERKTS